jgi:hypothetical protein
MEENKRRAFERQRQRTTSQQQLAVVASTTTTTTAVVVRVDAYSTCTNDVDAKGSMRMRQWGGGELPSSTNENRQRASADANDSSGPSVNGPDVESSAEEEGAKHHSMGGDGGRCSSRESLDIAMRSRVDDDEKLPACEIASAEGVTSGSVPPRDDGENSPTTRRKSGLPPIPLELRYDESRVLPIDDDNVDRLVDNATLDDTLLNGWSLFDHQREGVLRGLRMRRLILAFDMGLGERRGPPRGAKTVYISCQSLFIMAHPRLPHHYV